MVAFFASLLRIFLQAFRSKRTIVSENALLRKENEILLRRVGKKRVQFGFYDKLFFVVLNRAADIKHRLTLVKPETVLSWQRTLIKRFWTFEHRRPREAVSLSTTDVKNLILSMKNDNLLWGVKTDSGRTLEAGYLSEHKDYPEDSSGLQAEREDSEFPDLEEVSGNTDTVHLCDGLPHSRHHAGETVLCLRDHLTQNTRDYAVCHH